MKVSSLSRTIVRPCALSVLLFLGLAGGSALGQPLPDFDLRTEDARQQTVRALLEQSSAAKQAAEALARQHGWSIRGEIQGRVYELIAVENGRPVYYITHNVNAAISTAADLVRNTSPYNVDGDAHASGSWVVGVWDGGSIRASHQELVGRINVLDGASLSDHATHVGGTIGATGINLNAQGMAPRITLDSYDFNNDTPEMTSRAASSPLENGRLHLSNHSYGFIRGWTFGVFSGNLGFHWFGVVPEREDRGFGQYDDNAVTWDTICFNASYYLPFKSAGNDRSNDAPPAGTDFFFWNGMGWDSKAYDPASDPFDDGWNNGGFDTIGNNGVSKNIMTIGAIDDAVSGGSRSPVNGTMSSFSGWGPADDGRVKPDIVANGVNLLSPISSADTAYDTLSGTSMSSPNTTGSAVLLVDYFEDQFPGQAMRASTLKALIIHTADDLGNPGPDYRFGWGLMNTKAAADQIRSHKNSPTSFKILEDTLDSGNPSDTFDFDWDGITPIRATICWTDPPGAAKTALNDRTPDLVNDLDLRITTSGGGPNVLPFVLDVDNPDNPATTGDNTVDNVEQILISSPTPGSYTLTVSHKGNLQNGEQNYSLILSGQTTVAGGQTGLSIDDVSVPEGDAGTSDAVLTVTLSPASSQTVTVDFATADGTATIADNDYVANSGTLTFPPGSTTQTITVEINGDQTLENDESVFIDLSNPNGAQLANDQGTLLILNDEAGLAPPPGPDIPVIASFTPAYGPVGTVVTINGSKFGSNIVDNVVFFGTVRGEILSATPTQITAVVPPGTTHAPLSVSVDGRSAFSRLPFITRFDSDGMIDNESIGQHVDFSSGGEAHGLALGDFNNDGLTDVIAVNRDTDLLSIFRNRTITSSVSRGTLDPKVDLPAGVDPVDAAAGDLNSDGLLDLAVVNRGSQTVSVYENISTGPAISFTAKIDLPAGNSPSSLVLADFDLDGKLDIAVANEGFGTVSVFQNRRGAGRLASASFAPRLTFVAGSRPRDIAAADLNGDGRPEIVTANSFNGRGGNSIAVLENLSTTGDMDQGAFAFRRIFPTGASPVSVATVDFDGDGHIDIATANRKGASISAFLNTGNGSTLDFDPGIDTAVGNPLVSIAAGDIDGDGSPDLAFVAEETSTLGFLRNESTSGTLNFSVTALFATGESPRAIMLADLDQDGQPDIATANSSGIVSLHQNRLRSASPITWDPPPADITYGTALDGSTLNATSEIPGILVYNPGPGTILPAGQHELRVTLVPTDFINQRVTSITVTLNVDKAELEVTADDQTKDFGDPLPLLTVSITGFVDGDDETDFDSPVLFETDVSPESDAGFYPESIIPSRAVAANYTFDYQRGDFTVNPATPVITWEAPEAIPFGTALNGAQLNASSPVLGTFAYNPPEETVLPVGEDQMLSTTFTPEDTDNYVTAGASVSIDVLKATPAIVWETPATIPFGTPLSATQLNAMVTGVSGSFTYDPDFGMVLDAGDDQTLQVTFTPDDSTSYNESTAQVSIDILKATPPITWPEPDPITFGTALDSTQLNASSGAIEGAFTYDPPEGTVLNAGQMQTLSLTFTPTDTANYSETTAEVLLDVNPATPQLTWPAPDPIIFGTRLGDPQLNATAPIPGMFQYSPNFGTLLNSGGNQLLQVDFTPDDLDNYTSASASVLIDVAKAVPEITWNNPNPISYLTPLGVIQLNATVNVMGTLAYSPEADTVLDVGEDQILEVSFTPSDPDNYESASASVQIDVLKAVPEIAWTAPQSIPFDTALDSSQLNASSETPGTFTYNPAAGTLLDPGNHVLSVDFVPDDTVRFEPASASVALSVTKKTPEILWPQPGPISFGTALGPDQLNAETQVEGSFFYNPSTGTLLGAGADRPLAVSFIPDDSTKYTSATANTTIDVEQAEPVVTWPTPSDIVFGTVLDATQLNATADRTGTFAYDPPEGALLNAGENQVLSLTFTPADDINFATVEKTVLLNVLKADPRITWPAPAPMPFGTALEDEQLSAIPSVAGTFVYDPSAGTVLEIGEGQVLSTTFTPDDSENYNEVEATVLVDVVKGTPDIEWNAPDPIVFGTALGASHLNASANLEGTFNYSPGAGTVLDVGAGQILGVEFIPNDTATYNTVAAQVSIDVLPSQPPSVAIISPADGDNLTAGTRVRIATSTSDPDNQVVLVEFFVDGGSIGESTQAPFEFVWENPSLGPHMLTAVATDSTDASATSATVNVTAVPGVNSVEFDQTSGEITVGLTGDTDVVYDVQVSVDLVNWTTLGTITGTGDNTPFIDSTLAGQIGLRFYRIVPQP